MTSTVLVTRHPADCRPLADALRPHGIAVRPYPVMMVQDVDDASGWRAAGEAMDRSPGRVWLALASPRAPERLVRGARAHGLEELLGRPAAAVGDTTAAAATAAGLGVEVVGPGDGRGLAAALVKRLAPASEIVLACGRHRRRELPDTLAAAGHRVMPLEVYDMRATPPRELPPLPSSLDAVVVTSPRAARLYLDGVGGLPLPCQHWALGATTRDAAAAIGITCAIPAAPDLDALAAALVDAICPEHEGNGHRP